MAPPASVESDSLRCVRNRRTRWSWWCRTELYGATSPGAMEPTKEELATHIRKVIVSVLCEAMGLPTRPRPVVEALDQYMGAAHIAQEVVVRLGLAEVEQ